MNCEEFESIGLGAERDSTLSELQRMAAREHAGSCPRCAALQDSWQAATVELQFFADATQSMQAPARVEMRLRQEFRTRHHTLKIRRRAVIAAWALAAAAVVIGAVSWTNWKRTQLENAANHPVKEQSMARIAGSRNATETANGVAAAGVPPVASERVSAQHLESAMLVSDNDMSDFTLLPGSVPGQTDEASLVRVRMQRGALSALGLPVNEERAAEWIQVEMLVGSDGLPQAVRLLQ